MASLGKNELYVSDNGIRIFNIPDLIFKSIHFFFKC